MLKSWKLLNFSLSIKIFSCRKVCWKEDYSFISFISSFISISIAGDEDIFFSITSTEENIETEEELVIEEEEEEIIEEEETEEGEEYILNINSYKIHYTWCHSVDRMKEYNKKYVTDTIENLIDKGYSPCGNCKPYWKI